MTPTVSDAEMIVCVCLCATQIAAMTLWSTLCAEQCHCKCGDIAAQVHSALQGSMQLPLDSVLVEAYHAAPTCRGLLKADYLLSALAWIGSRPML